MFGLNSRKGTRKIQAFSVPWTFPDVGYKGCHHYWESGGENDYLRLNTQYIQPSQRGIFL